MAALGVTQKRPERQECWGKRTVSLSARSRDLCHFFEVVTGRLTGPPFKCMPETAGVGEAQAGGQCPDAVPVVFQTFDGYCAQQGVANGAIGGVFRLQTPFQG